MEQPTDQKQLAGADYEALDIEITISCVNGTLTEARYDEIIELLLPRCVFSDEAMTLIRLGKDSWAIKWIKRFKDYNFPGSLRPKITK
jgi:hypothetical protein